MWWDRHLVSGDYRVEIEKAIRACQVLIPIWSRSAALSPNMHDELELARRSDVTILPLRIHDAGAPMGYGSLQTIDVLDWSGELGRPELAALLKSVRLAIETRRPEERPRTIEMNGSVDLPAFFFPVSSHETRLAPAAALKTLDLFRAETILVSAYDTGPDASRRLIKTLERRRKHGATILLDSGNYEKARREDDSWTFETFRKALQGNCERHGLS